MTPTTPSTDHPETLAPDAAAQQARGEQWRRQILSAAVQLLERKGSQGMSMQGVANEASVSVGLIYKYFGNKEALVKEVILDVLAAIQERIPAAVDAAGPDPVEQVAAGFAEYCRVIDDHREAAMITYRESRYLSHDSRELTKDLEIRTAAPLHRAASAAREAGLFRDLDPDLFAYNLVLTAHAWALKHWYFETQYTIDEYIAAQTDLLLRGAVTPAHFTAYPGLLRQ